MNMRLGVLLLPGVERERETHTHTQTQSASEGKGSEWEVEGRETRGGKSYRGTEAPPVLI